MGQVLHGDDYVLPGFYATMQGMIEANPQLTLACCRTFHVDEAGEINVISVARKHWNSRTR